MGEPSKWMVAMRPGELGGKSTCKERAKRLQRVEYEDAIGVKSRRGKRRFMTWLRQVEQE